MTDNIRGAGGNGSNISTLDSTDAPLDNEISPLCQAPFSAGTTYEEGQTDKGWSEEVYILSSQRAQMVLQM